MGNDDPLPIRNLLLILAFLFNAVFLAGYIPVELPPSYQIPETITVRITGKKTCEYPQRYTTVQMDFKEYVKGVLPNEWGRSWDMDSLRAGAVAVKMYAWSMYQAKGYVWDCTWDQVYNPSVKSARTDQAVDDTWDLYLFKNGKPVRTFYNAWMNGCNIRNETNCMGQWKSKVLAEEGMSWKQILLQFYDGYIINDGRTIAWTCY